ncbi:MAG TPA: hypothetical protein VMJ32_02665 [Pirellulales bacterium]|nr:hypothetical protein [Pirellulales bacterium]
MEANARTVPSAGHILVCKPLLFCLAGLLALPGCHGCSAESQSPTETGKDRIEAAPKEKEKPKPDFDAVKLTIIPQKTGENDLHRRLVKPGHWTAAVEEMKANNFDFNGTLYADARTEAAGPPTELEHEPIRLAITRPAALPKGQAKFFEMLFFVPGNSTKSWLATELRNRGGAVAATPGPEPLTLMHPDQYNLVVLAEQPLRYQQLERFDSVRAPHASSQSDIDTSLHYYQVITPPLEKPLPLPSNVLAWTSIAYLIWDDVDPSLLSPEQQQALVDWLHWGGQLIISGPKSLDQLREKAFLGSYLPALPGEPLSITADMLKPLNKAWTLPVRNEPGQPLEPAAAWSGVHLLPQSDAKVLVSSGGDQNMPLVVERQVGRGRIVVTAFQLTQRDLWNWPSFDGFLNGCLLRRPPRVFSRPAEFEPVSVDWADQPGRYHDPLLVTGLRFFSRDWNGETGFAAPPATLGGPGAAGWNDDSAPANAARDSLRQAAGIVIPKADFVLRVLALYLLVLVPLNWLLFRSLGHVEWAWVATPLIAVGGMATVVKMAQLDIGFARSQTELAVLELHAGYPRGHLTRYTAMYTSLSTTYGASSDNPSTLMLPFPSDPDFEPRPGQAIDSVTFQSEPSVQLADYGISSNSTSLLHTEQMINTGGPIIYEAVQDATQPTGAESKPEAVADRTAATVTNQSNFILQRAAGLRRTVGDVFEMAWIGDLPPGRKAKLAFERIDDETRFPNDWSYDLSTGEAGAPKLSLQPLADLVRGSKTLQQGETRLVALIDGPLPGLQIDPVASQATRGGTLVVVNLQYPALSANPPQPDRNTHRDIATPQEERENESEPPPDDKPDTDS